MFITSTKIPCQPPQ